MLPSDQTETFLSVLHKLDIHQLKNEEFVLNNSIKHLIRSNKELKAYNTETWAAEAIIENEGVIERQKAKLQMVIKEIDERNKSTHNNNLFVNCTDVSDKSLL